VGFHVKDARSEEFLVLKYWTSVPSSTSEPQPLVLECQLLPLQNWHCLSDLEGLVRNRAGEIERHNMFHKELALQYKLQLPA